MHKHPIFMTSPKVNKKKEQHQLVSLISSSKWYLTSRVVCSPLPVGENLDSPPRFPPPWVFQNLVLPQEAFVISVPSNCWDQLNASLWSEKSSSKLNRVIHDFEIASNKVKYSKTYWTTSSDCFVAGIQNHWSDSQLTFQGQYKVRLTNQIALLAF